MYYLIVFYFSFSLIYLGGLCCWYNIFFFYVNCTLVICLVI